jgi:hypothetical protein
VTRVGRPSPEVESPFSSSTPAAVWRVTDSRSTDGPSNKSNRNPIYDLGNVGGEITPTLSLGSGASL